MPVAAAARSAAPIEPLRSTHSTISPRRSRRPHVGPQVVGVERRRQGRRRGGRRAARTVGTAATTVARGPAATSPTKRPRPPRDGRRGEATGGRRSGPIGQRAVAGAVAAVAGLVVGGLAIGGGRCGRARRRWRRLQLLGRQDRRVERAPPARGGRARGGPPGGGRRSSPRPRPSRPASAAAARHSVRSARRPSAPTASARRAASVEHVVAGSAGRARGRQPRRQHGVAGGDAGVAGVEGEAAAHRLDAARRRRPARVTSTHRPKRSSSCGRSSPSSGFIEPTSTKRAGWRWETPSRSTRVARRRRRRRAARRRGGRRAG